MEEREMKKWPNIFKEMKQTKAFVKAFKSCSYVSPPFPKCILIFVLVLNLIKIQDVSSSLVKEQVSILGNILVCSVAELDDKVDQFFMFTA